MLGYIISSDKPIAEETIVYLNLDKAKEVLENFRKAYPEQIFYMANMTVE